MGQRLRDQVAIVTGASRGIGRAISVALGAERAAVVLAARDVDALERTRAAVEDSGGRATVVVTELTEEESTKRLVASTVEAYGRLDILVNNAGVTHSAPVGETSTEAWDQCMAVNARGAFILCREALPVLKRASAAHIVNIASVVGIKGYALQSAYTASKHALRGMSISLAEELQGSSVRVHVLCPGGVETEMVGRVRPDIKKDELIRPEEIAEVVMYLVTHGGNAVIDEVRIRRAVASPWF